MALTQVKSDGIADGAVTTNDLSNSGVTAGTYGSSSAIPAITVDAKGRVTSATTNAISVESDRIFEGNTSAEAVDTGSGGHFKVITEGTERARIDSSGRLLVGTATSRDNWFNGSGQSPVIQSESSSSQNFFSGTYTSSGGGAAIALLGKARGTSYQVVNNADGLGRISFQGADGAQMVEAAFILAEVDGTPGANDMPGRLVFSTTADGASSPTERMRIDASGNITLPSGGNLGINGALPQSPLDVISNASSYGISLRGRSSDNVSQFRFVSNNHGSVYSLFESAPTYLATHVNGSERARIDSSGRLGIGTSSPGQALDVVGNTRTSNRFYGDRLVSYTATNGSFVQLIPRNAVGTEVVALHAAVSGNVGIGTASPNRLLHLSGATDKYISVERTGATTSALLLGARSGETAIISRGSDISSVDVPLSFQTGSTERARITATGDFKFNSGFGSVATAYGVRAWVNFNGAGTLTIRGSGNISSVTDNGVGQFAPNFSNAMPDTNYAGVCSHIAISGGNDGAHASPNTTSAASIQTGSAGAWRDPTVVCAAFFR
jgi:hypothetical protein